MPTYYTVKEAAKLLGVSTNTLYKYLLEGKIKASRGTAEGRFRIPPKSLEDFLGSPLPTSDLPPVTSSLQSQPIPTQDTSTLSTTPKSARRTLVRILLILALLALIADTLVNPQWSLTSSLLRLFALSCLFVLSYRKRGRHV